MTAALRSYVSGKWTDPAGEGKPVLDAVTGEEVARVSSAGIDMGAALDYGRRAGGPALRELTFHQRAALLKSLGTALREHRQELYALSARTGATLGDSKFDIDGGIGVLLSYASLVSDDADRPEPHQVEAFGPVSTILSFSGTDEVIELAARGRGSLAGSIVTADTGFAREVVLGLAPWHGRLLVLDREDAAEATGHGSPLPVLVHGGPGRAGGGEETGGIRGVLHHMQRTAVQASPRVLSAVTGRWVPGTERTADGGHPFRKPLAELRIGDAVVAGPRQVTLADIEHFAAFTGDTFYAHMDEEGARANPFFDGRVAHGEVRWDADVTNQDGKSVAAGLRGQSDIAARASGDSGSTWPPSTTIDCPVM